MLNKENIKTVRISFPMYDTPTGRIIGACLLGKPDMCNEFLKTEHSFFPEGGGNVDSLAASAFYAADRRYNLPIIEKYLNEGRYGEARIEGKTPMVPKLTGVASGGSVLLLAGGVFFIYKRKRRMK